MPTSLICLWSFTSVIGETIVTPSAIIYLLVKLRISPPGSQPAESKELSVDDTKLLVQRNHETDEKFLESKLDAETIPPSKMNENAHAPRWPSVSPIS